MHFPPTTKMKKETKEEKKERKKKETLKRQITKDNIKHQALLNPQLTK